MFDFVFNFPKLVCISSCFRKKQHEIDTETIRNVLYHYGNSKKDKLLYILAEINKYFGFDFSLINLVNEDRTITNFVSVGTIFFERHRLSATTIPIYNHTNTRIKGQIVVGHFKKIRHDHNLDKLLVLISSII